MSIDQQTASPQSLVLSTLSNSALSSAEPANQVVDGAPLFYLEVKASLLKVDGDGPTEGILKSAKESRLFSTLSMSSVSMSPFGNSACDNLGDTSRDEGSMK